MSDKPTVSVPTDPRALLTRAEAGPALTAAGYPTSSKTLSVMASRGGGPPYRLYGKYVHYYWGDLLQWAESRIRIVPAKPRQKDAEDMTEDQPLVPVRASSLPAWADCPRRGACNLFRRDIEACGYKLRQTPHGVGAAIGTAVHAAVALTLTEKAKSGSLAPNPVTYDCAIQTYQETAKAGLLYDQTSPDGRTAERQTLRLVRAYEASVAPDIKPVKIEEQFEADTGFGLLLTGRADLVAREPNAVDDLKTETKRGVHTAQIGAYSLLARSNGLEIERARLDHLRRVPLAKEQPPVETQIVNVAIAEGAAMAVLGNIVVALEAFRHGDGSAKIKPGSPDAFLANPSSNLCGPKYCAAFGTEWCLDGAEAHPEKREIP